MKLDCRLTTAVMKAFDLIYLVLWYMNLKVSFNDSYVACSPWNGGLFQASQVIGDISYDPDPSKRHTIIGAKALRLIYRIYSNETFDESSGEEVDERADDFERQVDTIGQKKHDELSSSVRTTFGLQEETSKAIQNDLTILAAGYFLIIAYVCISLGQMTRLKHKIWLSFAGVISTGLGIVVSLGLCSAFGLFYGPVHSVLPFLLLGASYRIL